MSRAPCVKKPQEKQKAPLFLERGWGEAVLEVERSMSHAASRT